MIATTIQSAPRPQAPGRTRKCSCADGPSWRPAGLRCEANYYGAEVELAHGLAAEGRTRLAEAARTCPSTFIEAHAAKAEARLPGVGAKAD